MSTLQACLFWHLTDKQVGLVTPMDTTKTDFVIL